MIVKDHETYDRKVDILGVYVSKITQQHVLASIQETIRSNRKATMLYANVYTVSQASRDGMLRDFFNMADIVFCDGVGVQWGAKILGQQIPERFTPPDWFPDLCQLCVENDFSMFLLGTKPGITEKVADIYQQRFPGLKICGTHHGYFDKSQGGGENEEVVKLINDSSADLLLVGFGMPLQEQWLVENLDALTPKVYLVVGAMFDFLAGETRRGPRWLTDHGFEWLTRLITEPSRLWRRYIIGIPVFFIRVLKQRFGGQN